MTTIVVRRPRLAPAGRLAQSIALISSAVLLAACSSSNDNSGKASSSASAATPKTAYTVGFIGPLSGTLGSVGTTQLSAFKAYIDYTNSHGGVNGHQIKLEAQDDTNTPAKGIAAAKTLISDNALAIGGPSLSAIAQAILPTIEDADLSAVTVGGSPEILSPVKKTVFQVGATASSSAQPMVAFAAALLGKSNFTMQLGPIDTPSGVQFGTNVAQLAQTNGFSLLGTTALPVAPGDVTALANRLIANKPDIILVQMLDVPLVTMVQKLRQLGYNGPIVNYYAGSSAKMFETLKDLKVYAARQYVDYDSTSKVAGVQQFVAAIDASNLQTAATSSGTFGLVYLSAEAIVAAIKTCGDQCTAAKVTDALNTLDVSTAGLTPANITFSSTNHQALQQEVFWHWDTDAPAAALGGKTFLGSVYSLDAK